MKYICAVTAETKNSGTHVRTVIAFAENYDELDKKLEEYAHQTFFETYFYNHDWYYVDERWTDIL